MPSQLNARELSSGDRREPPRPAHDRSVDVPFEMLAVKIATAVRMSGIGRSKFYELIKEGRIETIKVGTATLVPVADLRAFLDSHRRKPTLPGT